MSALTFRLKSEPDERLDLSHLTPSRLSGLDAKDIEGLSVGTTRRSIAVGDVFAVSGDDVSSIRFEGGSSRFDRVGEGMSDGEIHLEGEGGWYVGRLMRGGRITVAGSVGGFAGSGMSGGRLSISGEAGDFVGGPGAGEMTGMSGGVIIVDGRAGARAADRMRRGTILVRGDVGEDAASRMVAGTLIVGGRAAGTPGRLMKRGTVILSGGAERIGATFLDNGECDLLILRLMARDLGAELGGVPFDGAPMRRVGGDTAVMGLGEIFLP